MLGAMTAITLHAYLPLPLAIASAVLLTALAGALVDCCSSVGCGGQRSCA